MKINTRNIDNPKKFLLDIYPYMYDFGDEELNKYGYCHLSGGFNGWIWDKEKINQANESDVYKLIIRALVEKYNTEDLLADKYMMCPICNHRIGKYEKDYLQLYKKQIGAFVCISDISKPLFNDQETWIDERFFTIELQETWMQEVKDKYGIDAALEIRERYVEV